MAIIPELLKVDEYVALCIDLATYQHNFDEAQWKRLRLELLGDVLLKPKLPDFVVRYPMAPAFRSAMQALGGYHERRQHIWDGFAPLITHLQNSGSRPLDNAANDTLSTINSDTVSAYWQRALERRETEFEGAITMARTLLETVCKHILHDLGITGYDDWDLPKLYRQTAEQLNLAPEQHQEEVFKQILGGAISIANGLSGLRNRLSDSHGKGPIAVKPARRHAELAVNMAGSIASFLVSTWQERKKSPKA